MNEIEFNWKCVLADDSIINEANAPFDLSWEELGAVKEFSISNEIVRLGVDFETGDFFKIDELGEREVIEGGLPGNLGDFGLRFFKRNKVMFNTDKEVVGRTKSYYFGYVKGSEEKLLRVQYDADGSVVFYFDQR